MRLKHSPFVFIFKGKEYYGVIEMNSEQEGVFRVKLPEEEFDIELCQLESSFWDQADEGNLDFDFLQAVGDGITAVSLKKSE